MRHSPKCNDAVFRQRPDIFEQTETIYSEISRDTMQEAYIRNEVYRYKKLRHQFLEYETMVVVIRHNTDDEGKKSVPSFSVGWSFKSSKEPNQLKNFWQEMPEWKEKDEV